MKTSELMVGNILWYDPWASPVIISNIEEPIAEDTEGSLIIRRFSGQFWKHGDELKAVYFADDDAELNIHGIAINNQKFWEKNLEALNHLTEEGNVSFMSRNGEETKMRFVFKRFSGECSLRYIHELQNVLNLIGVKTKFKPW